MTSVAPIAIEPAASSSEYPCRRISGIAIFAMTDAIAERKDKNVAKMAETLAQNPAVSVTLFAFAGLLLADAFSGLAMVDTPALALQPGEGRQFGYLLFFGPKDIGVLRAIGAGCHTPAAAYATVSNRKIRLTAQLFSDDGLRMVDGVREGGDSTELGKQLAGELKSRLSQPS
mgnify:CR=1 FL=1